MGVLIVKGNSTKEFTCDVMYIKFVFKAWDNTSEQAIGKVRTNCNAFIQALENEGVSIENIHLNDEKITTSKDDKNIIWVNASRKIELRLKFNMNFLNCISDIVRDNGFTVDMDVSFTLSNMNEIHAQLIKDAVIDSKNKAEMIAQTMGQKVKGIIELDAKHISSDLDDNIFYDIFAKFNRNSESVSDRLKAPLTKEYENVEVKWEIE